MKPMTDFIGERDEPEVPPPVERIVLSYGGCGSAPWHPDNIILNRLLSKPMVFPAIEISREETLRRFKELRENCKM